MFSPKKQRMYIGHVGDSRCYRLRGGVIQQLTRDHSLINDYLLAMPDLTDEQKSELPKNVITRALGMQDQVIVDLQHDDPQPGDLYILCSDGLSGMVTDEDIKGIVYGHSDIREACRKLIQRANERGGEDNTTVIVIKIEDLATVQPADAADNAKTDPPTTGEDATLPGTVDLTRAGARAAQVVAGAGEAAKQVASPADPPGSGHKPT
jgi:protein phosphatase